MKTQVSLKGLVRASTAGLTSSSDRSHAVIYSTVERVFKKVLILVWNLVGAILSFDEHTQDVDEVELAEAARSSIDIKDHFACTLGCPSGTGVSFDSNAE